MKEPLVSIALRAYTRIFAPGDELGADFQIDAVEPGEVEAVEASVLWYTEGKGDEDLGVHFFQRFDGVGDEVPLAELRSIFTTLPHSPLSYDGRIVKIRWCVRVRAFLTRGRSVVADQWFQLGNVPSPSQSFNEDLPRTAGVIGGAANAVAGSVAKPRGRGEHESNDEPASTLAAF
jgi:hypothetical protein